MLSNSTSKILAGFALLMGLFGCSTAPTATQTSAPNPTAPAAESPELAATPAASSGTAGGSHPLVVVTNTTVCDLTKQIAGNTVDLKCIIAPGADPHIYQPKPEDRKAIEQAKLILYGGYNFEPSLIKLIKATINPKLIKAVAKEANVKVSDRELFGDGLGEKGTEGETYQGMLIANTCSIVEGLGGKYTPFSPK